MNSKTKDILLDIVLVLYEICSDIETGNIDQDNTRSKLLDIENKIYRLED